MDDKAVRELLCCGGKCGRPGDCWSGRERYTPSAKVAAVKAALSAAERAGYERGYTDGVITQEPTDDEC